MSDPEILAFARTRLGRVLRGKYKLDRILGIGGMAVVYAATHRNKKRFAIKMLHPELSLREGIRTRFLREGYIANSVRHPGAIAVLDDDVAEDGSAFVVMELLEGWALDKVWAQHGKHVPVSLALSIGDALLDVLVAAHANAIVHRDIKPANLFLTYDGRLHVLDFGIAQLHDDTSSEATATGAMIGTPAYMAPEQALGESHNIDGQTDLWAVGATLFTLLTSEAVHVSENASHHLVNAATKPARAIDSVTADVPAPIAAVIDRALAFDKADRWPTATAMRDALRRACVEATGVPIAALPTTERVSGLEQTMASSSDVAPTPRGGSDVAFGPTIASAADNTPAVAALRARAVSRSSASEPEADATSEPAPLAAPARRWSRTMLGIGAGMLAIAGGVLAITVHRSGSHAAAPPIESVPVASAPRPSRPPNAAAAGAYDAAVQAERDGNQPAEKRSLTAAIAADPALGSAYLRLVLYLASVSDSSEAPDAEAEALAAYHKALDHRATLGDLDAGILDAWEPRFRAPPDRAERSRRLAVLAKKFPTDVRVQTQLADSLRRSAQLADAATQIARALALDPTYIPALASDIETLNRLGDGARARALADRCIATSTSAVSCLELRLTMSQDAGQCADLKADAKRMIAIDPASRAGYAALADAMAALGEPTDSVAATLQRADALADDGDDKHLGELVSTEMIAVLRGDLGAGDRADGEAVTFASSRPSLDAIAPALRQLAIVVEEGDAKRARTLAKALRARIDAAGVGEPDIVTEARLATLLQRAGGITRDELHARQTKLVELQRADDDRRGGKTDAFRTWGWIYANDIEDAGDAADALAALAQAGGPDPKFEHVPYYSQGLGTMHAFSGHGAEAIPYLARAAASCYLLEESLDLTHDAFAMGVAKEKAGDPAGARAAYQAVVDRWGTATPRSVTADKARARLAALPK